MTMLPDEFIAERNADCAERLDSEYDVLRTQLARREIDIDRITEQVARFTIAIPSWGVGTGGTRFARFPGPGEPRDVYEKLEDCAIIHQLTAMTPTVSLHIPWDKADDYAELRRRASDLKLRFDAINSNTFQDQPEQKLSYKYGSLTHAAAAVREQAIAHNLECIAIGQKLGSKALTLWIGDGGNFPGQQNFAIAFDRYMESAEKIYAAIPFDWRLFIEYKMYEPALYSTVIQDWGSALMAAQALGPKASCLVDLGHHAPNVNIEMIVSRLIRAERLGGFHFNDSKYGDDDLDSGSINPYRLFLIFNELVDAAWRKVRGLSPAHMLDQSHNVTDPIESLITSAIEVARAYAQALIVDRDRLAQLQDSNDVLLSREALKDAFLTDVSPILAEARCRNGAAVDPIGAYRASGYRKQAAQLRPQKGHASASGIV
jgi:L-rhamnose isomerase/sugar isomerase